MPARLDAIDRKILKELQDDGRITNVELSRRVGISAPPCLRRVRAQPLVRECWMLSGEIDFVLKCVAPDLKTFQAFVEKLTAGPHVRNVKTSLTLRTSKDAAMVPME